METIATVTKRCPTCSQLFTIRAEINLFAENWGIDECPDCVAESLPVPCNICDEYLTTEERQLGYLCTTCRNEFP